MSECTLELLKPLQQAFRLGDWRVDPELNRIAEITSPHRLRTLEPRLMHLLCYLAANAGRVLTREQLIGELWPRVIVNDNSLTRAVSELRKQLTLPGRAGTDYLQTIPKRGYRLVCPVLRAATPEQQCSAPTAQNSSVTVASGSQLHWRRSLQLSACVVLAALVISFDYSVNSPPTVSQLTNNEEVYDQVVGERSGLIGGRFNLSALVDDSVTGAAGEIDSLSALSPDGSVLAFIHYEGELSKIYLTRTGLANDPVSIFSSEDFLYNLGWSPLGNALLFARQSATLLPSLLTNPGQHADLVMLDLDTLTLKILIDNSPEPTRPAAV